MLYTMIQGVRTDTLQVKQSGDNAVIYCEAIGAALHDAGYADPVLQFWTQAHPDILTVSLTTFNGVLGGQIPAELLSAGRPVTVALVLPPANNRRLKTLCIRTISVIKEAVT